MRRGSIGLSQKKTYTPPDTEKVREPKKSEQNMLAEDPWKNMDT